MSKTKVPDPITDQEKAYVRLLLTGTMSDEHAAQQAGFQPGVAAFVKAKPCVVAFMQQEADRLFHQAPDLQSLARARVIRRLLELAEVNPAATRGSIHGQVKALEMIVAVGGLMPAEAGSAFETGAADVPQGEEDVWASLKTSGKPN